MNMLVAQLYDCAMSQYPPEIINAARSMYLRRWKMADIQAALKLPNARVLYQWREKGSWADLLQGESVQQAISRKLVLLAEKDNKTDADYKEMDKLGDALLKAENVALVRAKRERLSATGGDNEANEASGSEKKPRRSKNKKIKNDVSGITKEMLDEVADKLFFGYQKLWRKIKNIPKLARRRFILKSRQIGATFYFSFEALEDAILTGDNQIFLSASRAQSEIFKAYIIAIAREYFDVELSGATITLSNGADLRFVSTNARTAQGYHGHVYFDEVFWVPDWNKLQKVASGMAMHKKWRKTYFSTPSAITHQAYPLWSGELYNQGKAEGDKVEFDLSHKTLKDGHLGPDGIWRHIVNIEDAIAQGCDLFDIDELRDEYNKSDFNNLLMCFFIDDSHSVFALSDLLACAVDRSLWRDFDPKAERPFGFKPVWLGFDPSRTRDNASVVVVAPPDLEYPVFRVLETLTFKGKNFTWQAAQIKKLVDDRYKVEHLGIDTTGIGYGVYDLVRAFYPRAKPIFYSLQIKTELVLKGISIIENKRLQYDAAMVDFPRAFLTIIKTTTGSGQITYAAGRTATTGHADMVWAFLHAVMKEKLNPKRRRSSVAIG